MNDPESLVADWARELELADDTCELAQDVARRSWHEYPVNRTARATAAGALYLAGLYANDKRTQDAVSDATGVHTYTIRDAYQDIWQYEDPDAFAAFERESDPDPDAGWGVGALTDYPFSIMLWGGLTLIAMSIAISVLPHLQLVKSVQSGAFGEALVAQHDIGLIVATCVAFAVAITTGIALYKRRYPRWNGVDRP